MALSVDHEISSFFKDDNEFLKFKEECSKTGTTEEAIAVGEKIGFKTNLLAINPLNPKQKVPVFFANFVLMDYGFGAVFGCPAHDQRDFDFAKKYDLKITTVVKPNNENDNFQQSFEKNIKKKDDLSDSKNETINQIKNISQNRKIKPENEKEIKAEQTIFINSFDQLLKTCNEKKEIKLKYELEKNVSLVHFANKRIEISFNDNLDKNFVKDLSTKLFEWTSERWIISFSQLKGDVSMREKKQKIKRSLIDEAKNSKIYKDVIKNFPDAELTDINLKREDEPND